MATIHNEIVIEAPLTKYGQSLQRLIYLKSMIRRFESHP